MHHFRVSLDLNVPTYLKNIKEKRAYFKIERDAGTQRFEPHIMRFSHTKYIMLYMRLWCMCDICYV